MLHYIAVVHQEGDSAFGVSFPDFPGCITGADTLEQAKLLAPEALLFHIEGMLEDGETLPEASGVAAEEDAIEYFQAILPEPKREPIKVNMTFDPALINEIDKSYKDLGYTTRSAFFAAAARDKLGE